MQGGSWNGARGLREETLDPCAHCPTSIHLGSVSQFPTSWCSLTRLWTGEWPPQCFTHTCCCSSAFRPTVRASKWHIWTVIFQRAK